MLIYETDTQYILEHENIRIIADKKDCTEDYEAYLQAELEKALQNIQNAPQTFMADGTITSVTYPHSSITKVDVGIYDIAVVLDTVGVWAVNAKRPIRP